MARPDDNNQTPTREQDTDTSERSGEKASRKPSPARLFSWVDLVRDAKHLPPQQEPTANTSHAVDAADREKSSITTTQTETEEYTDTPPYHVFGRRKKWQLVLIVSLAGLFSPLSSNIYFPALGAIAEVCLPP